MDTLAELSRLAETLGILSDNVAASMNQADQIIRTRGALIDELLSTLKDSRRYFEIGMATVAWSSIEFGLDASNILTLDDVPGGDALARELPRALDRKLDLFERAYRQLPDLAPFRSEALEIAAEVKALKDHRHDFVHGVGLIGTDGQMRVARLLLRGNTAFRIERPLPLSRIEELRERMLTLAARMSKLTDALIATFRAPH